MAMYAELHDGRRLEFPDGTDPAVIQQTVKRLLSAQPEPDPAAHLRPEAMRGKLASNVLGALRGAGSIGATLATPFDMLLGNTKSIGNPERRKAMDEAATLLGADTGSMGYQLPKLMAEVAGTAGTGGVLARGAGPLAQAVRTGGFSAGGLAGLPGLAARTAGGAVTGGAAAAAINPDDAGIGAIFGALLPGGMQAAGAAGRAVAAPFRSTQTKTAEALIKALDNDPARVAAALRQAQELVPGSKPTVAQVLRSPQASTLERIVSESPGGAGLKERYLSQNAARLSALDQVAPTDPRGFRSAQQDFGESALSAIRGSDKKARAATSAAFQQVPQTEPVVYLPDLAGVRDKYFPRGAFGGRSDADTAVRVADQIGNIELPAITAAKAGGKTQTLAQAVRQAGGISIENNSGLRGEVAALRGDLKNLVRRNGGKSPAEIAELMQQRGFLQSDSTDELFEALRNEAMGGYAGSTFDDVGRAGAAARDAAMGAPPGAERVPQKVTLGEFDALRKSIGNAQRAAKLDPNRATEALALSEMKQTLDDKLNQVIGGDGAIDEMLPAEWADALDAARKLKVQQVQKYRTGPQALAFRTGSDGLPMVQGGEFAQKVWGNRPGIADDIAQARKALDDHPKVLGQFRSMITTEGASTATAGGNLTGKFVKWVDNALPGLEATFKPDEVKALRRIAQDIKRAEVAAAAGAARGSPTYQNAANALSVGLLDSPLVNFAANKIPVVGQFTGPMLQSLKRTAGETKAKALAQMLADPDYAANALNGLLGPGYPQMIGLQRGLLYAAPALAAD